MKSILKFIFRAMAFCLAAGAAHAQTATLNINGRITNTPCTISVGNVNMGDVPISEVGSEQHWKNFSVSLGGCELSTLNTAALRFTGTIAGSALTLALKTGTGAAQGFGVMIMTNDSTHLANQQVVFFNGSSSYSFNVNSGKKSFDFRAMYTPLSNTTVRKPGIANATATITLTYS